MNVVYLGALLMIYRNETRDERVIVGVAVHACVFAEKVRLRHGVVTDEHDEPSGCQGHAVIPGVAGPGVRLRPQLKTASERGAVSGHRTLGVIARAIVDDDHFICGGIDLLFECDDDLAKHVEPVERRDDN